MIYRQAKTGVFLVETNKYDIKVGWIRKEEEYSIIGENDEIYITRFLNSGYEVWEGTGKQQVNYTLPIGIHKTRFVRWKNIQLHLSFISRCSNF